MSCGTDYLRLFFKWTLVDWTENYATDIDFKRDIVIQDDPPQLAKQAAEIIVARARGSWNGFNAVYDQGNTVKEGHKLVYAFVE